MKDTPGCVCKGIRFCALCENLEETKIRRQKFKKNPDRETVIQQYDFDKPQIEGILVVENFITHDEENIIAERMNKGVWVDSQSGRRKQDYGPKANFKRKKAKLGTFEGIPNELESVFIKMRSIPELNTFDPVEALFLEYDPTKGAHIEPHFDDDWLWVWCPKFSGDSFLS